MALLDLPIADSPSMVSPAAALPVTVLPGLGYWVTINDVIEGSIQVGSLTATRVLNGKSSMQCTLLNPTIKLIAGQRVTFVAASKVMFGGRIKTITLSAPPDESVLSYQIDCAGWEDELERIILNTSYTFTNAGQLIKNALADGGVLAEGFHEGQIDTGPLINTAVADFVKLSEYLRDVATAGGGAIEIDTDHTVNFRRVEFPVAPFAVLPAEVEDVQVSEDLDGYTNFVNVHVDSNAGSNTAFVSRFDAVEMANRAAVEGGRGLYQTSEKITHPTSNDVVELARYGITYALMILSARGRVNKPFTAKLRRPLLDIGQIINANLPGMDLFGNYQITNVTITDEGGLLLYEISATFASKRNLNLDSMLKVIQAAKATIVLPVNNWANTVTLTSGGTWTVPGSGMVEVEIASYGPGGGGAGGMDNLGLVFSNGGEGGAGGRAISLRSILAGTVLTIVVGTGGAGGGTNANGGAGSGPTYVGSSAEPRIAQGDAGDGGIAGFENNARPGAYGSGIGDYIAPAQGGYGGAGGIQGGAGSAGTNGKVVIRY